MGTKGWSMDDTGGKGFGAKSGGAKFGAAPSKPQMAAGGGRPVVKSKGPPRPDTGSNIFGSSTAPR